MRPLNLALIGAGNIMAHRHLPFLVKHPRQYQIVAISDRHPEKARRLARQYGIPHVWPSNHFQEQHPYPWFKKIDAIVIATPPFTHADLIQAALPYGKHLLVEKPFVVDLSRGEALIKQARRQGLILAVNHNFQFATSVQKLKHLMSQKKQGRLLSLSLQQFSNEERRLPQWTEKLPLGLVYDETPHFIYLTEMITDAPLVCQHAALIKSPHSPATPQILTAQFQAGKIPVNMYLNFNSPICEWLVIAIFAHRFVLVDLFRDILINLPSDGQHLGKEVIRTSLLTTYQHWAQFIQNGPKYLTGNFWWGFDEVYNRFYRAVLNHDLTGIKPLDASRGLHVNQVQHTIISKALSLL